MSGSQTIETATTSISVQPDSKSKRYDRQLRLWATSGQSALEAAHILVLGADATSAAILKNLVLPGIGHFTLVDDKKVTPADAGNNFFLNGWDSVGRYRSEEVTTLLIELNDQVEGRADTRNVKEAIEDKNWVKGFTIIVAHNLENDALDELASYLWEDVLSPPLIVVRSAGFLAEFYIQYHEHTVAESHLEVSPTLRISVPFRTLLKTATHTPFSALDPTDHSHVPYPLILVHALNTWRSSHDHDPTTSAEKQDFKKMIRDMKKKPDEENFEEAEAQAWRVWMSSGVPHEVQELFTNLEPASPKNEGFYVLLQTLKKFTELEAFKGLLPLAGTLPDMKSDTKRYIALQQLYKGQARTERAIFIKILEGVLKEKGLDLAATPPPLGLDTAVIDAFILNAHVLRVLVGAKWGLIDGDAQKLAIALQVAPRETATHIGLSALLRLRLQDDAAITEDVLKGEAAKMFGKGVNLESVEEWKWAAGEIVRAPSAELPTTAAFMGGMVAQEAIKMITRQYVPVNGYCVVDLIDSSTGTITIES